MPKDFKAGKTDSPISDRSGIVENNFWPRLYLCPSVVELNIYVAQRGFEVPFPLTPALSLGEREGRSADSLTELRPY